MAMTNLNELYDGLCKASFPALGKELGDFPLYDSMLAGLASRALKGQLIEPAEIPEPDEATLETVVRLRKKMPLAAEERAFLEYFEILEAVRRALLRRN